MKRRARSLFLLPLGAALLLGASDSLAGARATSAQRTAAPPPAPPAARPAVPPGTTPPAPVPPAVAAPVAPTVTSTPWREALESRLAALAPERAADYLVLAEEVLDHATPGTAGDADRALARRLAGLAGAIDLAQLGRSAALLLADTAPSDAERLRMQSVAGILGVASDDRPAAAAHRADAASALVQAFAYYRRGDGARAKEALARNGAAALLDAHPEVLAGGSARFRTECDAMRSGMAPALGPAQSEALHALAGGVIAGRPRTWSEAIVQSGAAPLPEINLADPRSLFGVDPAECLWRDGGWTRAQPRG